MRRMEVSALALAAALAFGGCGDSGGDGGTGPTVPTNREPTASFTLESTGSTAPAGVSVDGTGSSDPDGSVTAWRWSFGDGTTADGATASHLYEEAGSYTITLTVTDDDGATASTTRSVTVAAATANSISGITWLDANLDGVRQADEPGFPGIPVFLDADGDGVLDPGERVDTSGIGGVYRFDGLAPGAYRVTQALPLGWTNTEPGPGASAPPVLRLIDGSEAPAGAHPYMASIQLARIADRHDAHICGGSLIAPGWVLTAAHCIADNSGTAVSPSVLEVLIGTQRLDGSGTRVAVERVIVNPGYSPAGGFFKRDIGLLELAQRFETRRRIFLMDSTVFVPTVQPNTVGTVIGWGLVRETADGIPVPLHTARMPYREPEVCRERYGADLFERTMLCVGDFDGTPAVCSGDSGGPLFFTFRGQPHQAGIVSWGLRPCARPNAPDVFASVPAMIDFVRGHVPPEPSGSVLVALSGAAVRVDFGNFH